MPEPLKISQLEQGTASSADLLPIVDSGVTKKATVQQVVDAGISGNSGVQSAVSHVSRTDNPHSVTKTQVGLGNVDNTSDANKPISSATATALAGKADKTTTVNGKPLSSNVDLTKSDIGLSSVPNLDTTSAVNQAHSHTNKTILDNILLAPVDTVLGGTNVTVSRSGNTVTINSIGGGSGSGNQGAFAYEKQIATAGQTAFNIVGFDYVVGNNLQVFLNGQKLVLSEDYLETDTDTVTIVNGASAGDSVEFYYPNKGLNWKGEFSEATAYVKDDAVSYLGSSYICILATTGNLPTNATYWNVLAQKGTPGTNGSQTYDAIVPDNYPLVSSALAAGHKSIFVRDGVYVEPDAVTFNVPGVFIEGESREGAIIRFSTGKDGVRVYSNDSTITTITLDALTNNAEAAYVVGDGAATGSPDYTNGNRNRLTNVKVLGSNNTFAIFLAGAATSAGAQTLANFHANQLHEGNVVEDCYLYSAWTGDSFSFSLQKNGSISRNRCYGGRIAFYMTRNSVCAANVSIDSSNQGVFVGGPSEDNVIALNSIYSPASAGIKMQNQLEHPVTGMTVKRNAVFGNNIVDSGYSGIEVNESESCTLSNNTIHNAGTNGIYVQTAAKNSIIGNAITDPNETSSARGSGIYFVASAIDNVVSGNEISDSRATAKMYSAICNREGGDCTGNVITENVIKGKNTQRTIWLQSNRCVVSNNLVEGGNYGGIYLDAASYCTVTGNNTKNNTNDANNVFGEIFLQNGASFNMIDNTVSISDATNKMRAVVKIDAGCNNNMVGQVTGTGIQHDYVDDSGSGNKVYHKLVSGTDTAYHYHSSDRLRSNHTGDENHIPFNLSPSGVPNVAGTLSWNPTDETLDLNQGNGVVQQIGQETFWKGTNQGGGIGNGKVVYASGALGASGNMVITQYIANGTVPSMYTLGITTENIETGETGFVTSFGKVRGINTTGTQYGETWLEGDVLYAHPTMDGALTKVAPQHPNVRVPIAFVINVHANNGTIAVRTPTHGDLLVGTSYQTATAGQTAFTVPKYEVGANKLRVSVNGLEMALTEDYAETNSTTVTFAYGLTLGDKVKFTILAL